MTDIIDRCTDWTTTFPSSSETEIRDFGWRTAFQQSEIDDDDEEDGFEFSGRKSGRVRAFERRVLPRTRPEIYATPMAKGERLVLAFEGNGRLIGRERARGVLRG